MGDGAGAARRWGGGSARAVRRSRTEPQNGLTVPQRHGVAWDSPRPAHNGRSDDQRTATPRAADRSDRHRGVLRRPGVRRPLHLSRRHPDRPGRGPGQLRDLARRAEADLPPYPFPDRIEGLPPTLTISITGDSSTPYDAGIQLAEALGSSLLTVEGEQHTVVAAGTNACVADSTPAYLVDLRTPPADAHCAL
jgi:hypothetical protein